MMDLTSLLFPLLLVLLFVPLFFSFRRQKRVAAQQQELLNSLQPGDRIMTTSGVYGTIAEVSEDDDTIKIEIAPGMVTTWLRQAIREKVTSTPDADTSAESTPENSAGA
jgi:preprotein translocase subunit YajC